MISTTYSSMYDTILIFFKNGKLLVLYYTRIVWYIIALEIKVEMEFDANEIDKE